MSSNTLYQWNGPSHIDGLVTVKALELVITNQQGRKVQARLVISDDANHGQKQTLPFEAVYGGENRWTVSGRNVLDGNEPVPNRVFNRNPSVEQSVRRFVLEKLADFTQKNPAQPKSSPKEGNGSVAPHVINEPKGPPKEPAESVTVIASAPSLPGATTKAFPKACLTRTRRKSQRTWPASADRSRPRLQRP